MNDETARRVIQGLDNIEVWLQRISSQLAGGQAGVIIEQQGRLQSLLELLVSMQLPSAPSLAETIAVPSANAVLLCLNNSQTYQRYSVTNDDPAQPLWVGPDAGVMTTNGRVIIAQTTQDFVIPKGGEIWGICMAGAISVRVSTGYDFVGGVQVG